MSNKSRGAQRERDVASYFRERGWTCSGTGDAHGRYDLMCLHADYRPRLVEVKSTKAGPYTGFLPADRRALSELAAELKADALLAWWPYDRQGLRLIPESSWP